MIIGAAEVESCHTDIVYVQPIKEIKFLDDWNLQYGGNNTQGTRYKTKINSEYLMSELGNFVYQIFIYIISTMVRKDVRS